MKVTVTNLETGKSSEVVTDDSGFYSVTNLPPGLYTVQAELAGFKAKVLKDVRIGGERIEGVSLALELGAVTEQVTVSGNTLALLQAEDATIGVFYSALKPPHAQGRCGQRIPIVQTWRTLQKFQPQTPELNSQQFLAPDHCGG